MKLASLVCVSCAILLPAYAADKPTPVEAGETGPKMRTMERLPSDGFENEESLYQFAKSLEPAGAVEKMSVAGETVWILTRTISLGGSTAEFSIYHGRDRRLTPFMIMPLSLGEFKAVQDGAHVSLQKYDYKRKRYDEVFRIMAIP